MHESLLYASVNTSDVTQDVSYNYLEMQICKNNLYIGLVAEKNIHYKIIQLMQKIEYQGVLKEDKSKFPFQVNLVLL